MTVNYKYRRDYARNDLRKKSIGMLSCLVFLSYVAFFLWVAVEKIYAVGDIFYTHLQVTHTSTEGDWSGLIYIFAALFSSPVVLVWAIWVSVVLKSKKYKAAAIYAAAGLSIYSVAYFSFLLWYFPVKIH